MKTYISSIISVCILALCVGCSDADGDRIRQQLKMEEAAAGTLEEVVTLAKIAKVVASEAKTPEELAKASLMLAEANKLYLRHAALFSAAEKLNATPLAPTRTWYEWITFTPATETASMGKAVEKIKELRIEEKIQEAQEALMKAAKRLGHPGDRMPGVPVTPSAIRTT